MNYRKISQEIWKNYHSANWKTNDFCLKKNFICCLLSELAYEHIPKYELNQTSRIKIIPSESYWLKYINKQTFNISTVLSDMDFGENFIIENDDLIIVGVKLRNTIFINIRGTQSFNDAIVDAKFFRMGNVFGNNVKLHKGFTKAVLKEYKNIENELLKYSNSNVYIMGHSLGGAMSAILYNLLITNEQLINNNLEIKSCYTFGMPRFGNIEASKKLKSPYQTYNTNDVVPVIPPKCLGYENSPEEYELLNNGIRKSSNQGKLTLIRTLCLINKKDFKEHSINLYSKRLRNTV